MSPIDIFEEGLDTGLEIDATQLATDNFGNIIGIYCAASGRKIVTYQYDAWGNCTVTYGDQQILADYSIAANNPFRYRGYYYDNETGWYYLQTRYYDPSTERFLNADGYVSTGMGLLGYNMYTYCNNDLIMYIDPYGRAAGELAASLWWLCGVDGLLPIGDIIYGVAIVGGLIFDAYVISELIDSSTETTYESSSNSKKPSPPSPNNNSSNNNNSDSPNPNDNKHPDFEITRNGIKQITKKYGARGVEHFNKLARKGIVRSVGQQGIKRLGQGVLINRTLYLYELKAMNAYANYRVYGYVDALGKIIFDLFGKARH